MTLLVLVPDLLGYVVYLRRPGDRPRRENDRVQEPGHLRTWTSWLKGDVLVVLVGDRFVNDIASVVLPRADLLVVPLPWMRGLPPHATAKRAARAVHIATSYLRTPLQLRLRDNPYDACDDIPF